MQVLRCTTGPYLNPSFQLAGERPYLQLDPLYTSRPLNLTLVVKTTEAAGMLLYHGDTDHLAVELFHGRVRVSLDVGNPPASTMFSYAVLNDDKPDLYFENTATGVRIATEVENESEVLEINHEDSDFEEGLEEGQKKATIKPSSICSIHFGQRQFKEYSLL